MVPEGGGKRGLEDKPLISSSEYLHPPTDVRVLIVEDEWLVSMDIEAALLDGGFSVVGIAVSAEEAIEMAGRLKPHVATMDIRLHGSLDGIHAANELYRRFGLRCLFVSAYSDGTAKERAAAAMPLGWLQKPVFAPHVVVALQNALRDLR